VPHPLNGALFLKLRDDAATVQTLNMPVIPATQAGTASPMATPAQPSGPSTSSIDKAEP
jgi:hypothetical protein